MDAWFERASAGRTVLGARTACERDGAVNLLVACVSVVTSSAASPPARPRRSPRNPSFRSGCCQFDPGDMPGAGSTARADFRPSGDVAREARFSTGRGSRGSSTNISMGLGALVSAAVEAPAANSCRDVRVVDGGLQATRVLYGDKIAVTPALTEAVRSKTKTRMSANA